MNKRLWITAVLVFLAVWLSDWVIHGMALKGMYEETAGLWRTMEDMKGLMIWMLLGQLFIAFFFTRIFVKGYEGKGWMEGVRFGLMYIGPLFIAPSFINYAIMPIPMTLMWAWAISGLVQCVVVGWVAAWAWQKSATWAGGATPSFAGK